MDEQTKQAIEEAVAKGFKDSELTEIIRKFTPGDDGEDSKNDDSPKFKSFGEQLISVMQAEAKGGTVDPRLKATGLSEGVPSAGGFLVQQEFIDKLLEETYATGILASKCYKQPVGAAFNGVKIPAVDETSRADGSRWGGIQAYWLEEAGTKNPTKPKFRQISLELKKLIGLCYATDELLQDEAALEGYIKRWFPLEIGFKLDDAIINGTGAGQPLGILNSACLVTVSKETGQGANTILTENIVKMWSRMSARSRAKAIWLINQDIEPQLFTMSLSVGVGGIPVYMPANGLSGRPFSTLMGRDVVPIEQCQTLGTVGDIMLVDMSQYVLADKGGIQAASSIHVKFLDDETAFRFVYRVDGQPMWTSALTPYKGGGTKKVSPFVALATRGT